MRRLGYGLLALLVALAMIPALAFGWRQWEAWRNLAPARSAQLDERVLFESVQGQPLGFNVSTHQGWFALQGFAIAPSAVRSTGLSLTIEVSLQGEGESRPEKRYLALPAAEGAQPYGLLDGRESLAAWILPTEWIDLSDRPDVRSVSVRVLDRAAGVQTVLWRGAIDQRLSDAQVQLRYRSLSDASRDQLTRNWVTPPALVEPRLKRELLRYRQQRIGPLGRPGEAFAARRVLRHRPDVSPRRYDPRPLAIPIAPLMHVGVALDQAREVVVDARALDGSLLPVLVSGPHGTSTRPRTVALTGLWQGPWMPGRYLFQSDTAGDLEVRDADSGDSLVPSGLRPRTQRVSAMRRLHYRLHPLGDAPPPVRLRLRAERTDARVQVQFLDAAGSALASSSIAVPWRASRYDRLSAALDRPASEAVQVDIAPPASARRLVLASDRPVLAMALTTLGRNGRVGGDRWFSFQPEIDPRSVLSQGIVVVEQPRPLRRNEGTPGAALKRLPGPGGTSREASEAPRAARPRLRLRPERADPAEAADGE